MTDPTLSHDFVVGDRVRGKPEAGPNDRHVEGVVVAIGPFIEGHTRDLLVEGRYADTGAHCSLVMIGTEVRRWTEAG